MVLKGRWVRRELRTRRYALLRETIYLSGLLTGDLSDAQTPYVSQDARRLTLQAVQDLVQPQRFR